MCVYIYIYIHICIHIYVSLSLSYIYIYIYIICGLGPLLRDGDALDLQRDVDLVARKANIMISISLLLLPSLLPLRYYHHTVSITRSIVLSLSLLLSLLLSVLLVSLLLLSLSLSLLSLWMSTLSRATLPRCVFVAALRYVLNCQYDIYIYIYTYV